MLTCVHILSLLKLNVRPNPAAYFPKVNKLFEKSQYGNTHTEHRYIHMSI